MQMATLAHGWRDTIKCWLVLRLFCPNLIGSEASDLRDGINRRKISLKNEVKVCSVAQHNTTRLTGLATQTENKPLASFKGRGMLLLWKKTKKSDYRSHTISKRNKRASRLRGWENKLGRLLLEVAWRQMRLNAAIKEVCQSDDRHLEPAELPLLHLDVI